MKVIITKTELQANGTINGLITNQIEMTLNSIVCIYGDCTAADAITIESVVDVDALEISNGVLLPKEVVEG